MQIKQSLIEKAIKRKFIRPLNDGCKYNVDKFNEEKKVKHRETLNLLTQAYLTINNAEKNLSNYNLVDANTLLRSAFEYIMVGMMIQFDENVYNEFIDLGIGNDRDKTRICEIIDKFRTHMNEISANMYKKFNRQEKLKMLRDLYDQLCNFTHSSLIVSTMIEVKSEKEKEVFKKLMYENHYFLKILLFCCLKYFTNDDTHYLELNNLTFSFMFFTIDIGETAKKYNIDFSKYNEFLYLDKNIEFFKKKEEEKQEIKEVLIEIDEGIKENQEQFINDFKEFLN